MPPFVQSANWTSLLRQAGRLLTRPIPQGAGSGATSASAQGHLSPRQVYKAISRIIQETFPSSISHSTYHPPPSSYLKLNPAYIPLRPGSELSPNFQRAARLRASRAGAGFHSAASNTIRGSMPRGNPSNVGLGAARTYASGPSAAQMFNVNVPVVLRALADRLREEDQWPKPSHNRPYNPKKRVKKVKAKGKQGFHHSLFDSKHFNMIASERSHYFPRRRRSDSQTVVLPPLPEELVTRGATTTLRLPLPPSLYHIMDPSPRVSYRDAEIGGKILANLLGGNDPMMEAFEEYRETRLLPLLAKLESLGLLDWEVGETNTVMHVERDADRYPETLVITFYGRSALNVKVLLGDVLKPQDYGAFWRLDEWASTVTEFELFQEDHDSPTARAGAEAEAEAAVVHSEMREISPDEVRPEQPEWEEERLLAHSTTSRYSHDLQMPILHHQDLEVGIEAHLAAGAQFSTIFTPITALASPSLSADDSLWQLSSPGSSFAATPFSSGSSISLDPRELAEFIESSVASSRSSLDSREWHITRSVQDDELDADWAAAAGSTGNLNSNHETQIDWLRFRDGFNSQTDW